MSFFESVVYFFHTSRVRNLGSLLAETMTKEGIPLVRVDDSVRAALVVFRGARGWSVAVTDPYEAFFLERGAKGNEPRLVDVARRLGRASFGLLLQGDATTTICEVDGTGRLHISGGYESRKVYGERILRQHFRKPRFRSKAVPEALRAGLVSESDIEREVIAETLAPNVSPETLLYRSARLCGRELRPADAVAFATAAGDELSDPDFDRDDG